MKGFSRKLSQVLSVGSECIEGSRGGVWRTSHGSKGTLAKVPYGLDIVLVDVGMDPVIKGTALIEVEFYGNTNRTIGRKFEYVCWSLILRGL